MRSSTVFSSHAMGGGAQVAETSARGKASKSQGDLRLGELEMTNQSRSLAVADNQDQDNLFVAGTTLDFDQESSSKMDD